MLMEKENRINRRQLLRSASLTGLTILAFLLPMAESATAQTPTPQTPSATSEGEDRHPRTPFSFKALLPLAGILTAEVLVFGALGLAIYRNFLKKS